MKKNRGRKFIQYLVIVNAVAKFSELNFPISSKEIFEVQQDLLVTPAINFRMAQ